MKILQFKYNNEDIIIFTRVSGVFIYFDHNEYWFSGWIDDLNEFYSLLINAKYIELISSKTNYSNIYKFSFKPYNNNVYSSYSYEIDLCIDMDKVNELKDIKNIYSLLE